MFIHQDFVINAGGNVAGHGAVGEVLGRNRFDPGMLRPFFEDNPSHPMRGQRCVIVNSGRFRYDDKLKREVPIRTQVTCNSLMQKGIHSPVWNATTLRKEEWIELDRQILRAARYRLRAWADLAAANSFGGFNGMSKLVLEHETMSDPGFAVVDMDGITPGNTNDTPIFQLEGVPLPITHADFYLSNRRLLVSQNSGTPLNTTLGEAAARRVAETVEKTTIGNNVGVAYGGASTYVGGYGRTSQVYGYTNFPARITYTTLTAPTAGGWTAATTISNVLAMRQQMLNHKFYGPWMLYHSNDWDTYLDNDYILTGGNVATQTLRERLRKIDGIQDVKRLDFLFSSATDQSAGGPGLEGITTGNPFTLLMVQMTSDVAQAVNGLDITTIQWEEKGGQKLCFKVMCIQVPRLRADYYGNCGILHATTS